MGTPPAERAPSSQYPIRPTPVRLLPESARVAFPRGAIPATALTGIAAAALIPVDRPGIGWLLTGSITAAAIYAVDRTARRNPPASSDAQSAVDPHTPRTESTVSAEEASAGTELAKQRVGGGTKNIDASTPARPTAAPAATAGSSDLTEPAPALATETPGASTEQQPVVNPAAPDAAAGPARPSETAHTAGESPSTPEQALVEGATARAEAATSVDTAPTGGPDLLVGSGDVSTRPHRATTQPIDGPGTKNVAATATGIPIAAVDGPATDGPAAGGPATENPATEDPTGPDPTGAGAAAEGSGLPAGDPGYPSQRSAGTPDPATPSAAGARPGASESDRSETTRTDSRQVNSAAAVAPGTRGTAAPASAGAAASLSAAAALPPSDASNWGRVWWSALALALLAVGTFRAAEWLFVLCALAAAVVGSLAIVRRSIHGVLFDMVAVPLAALIPAVPWLYRGVERVRRARMPSNQRVWWSLLVTVLLLLVLVPLLAGADAVFARLVDGVIPALDMEALLPRAIVFAIAASGIAGALFLLAAPPPAAPDANHGAGKPVPRRLSRVEWGLPVGAVTVLFAVFVATQLAVLFGGHGYVQRTAELTYAEYARSGFWQLSIVSMLTLAVIMVVQRWAAQRSQPDRVWLRAALTAVSVLTLVIVASALSRMWTYQQAYGFTTLRLLVVVFELWIGALYLLVLASLIRLRQHWLPRAAIGAAAATLLTLSLLNPERLVAERNIDRWEAGKRLDTSYLSELSADVVPAADRLPEPLRAAVVNPIRARLDEDPWQGWNLSRSSARR
ncbi:DUF4153 domain-containing protein [Nocardia uniformis]|uniref:DUF4153 domain-containing protein n=1 Tax=Nocardia uniformis TaxID=53432 RepID=UPI001FE0B506|nr:DUF4173 domain-containing protein [Nocardia uniformis]